MFRPLIAMLMTVSFAIAQAPPTFLNVSDANSKTMVVKSQKPVIEQRAMTVTDMVDGKAVTKVVTVNVTRMVEVMETHDVSGATLSTMDGKPAEWQKANGKIVVISTGPLADSYKKLFAADTLLITYPEAKAMPAPPAPEKK